MPHVINGIGTWHWGKRNLHKETGTCEFCRAFGELKSYDTTLFFVVFFVPLIPLKQERVLRSCPRCRKFRVMKLKAWNAARQKDLLATVEALRTDSRNPENVARAIRTVVAYQDEPAFLRLATVICEGGCTDSKVQGLLGAGYAYFLKYSEAESCYRESLRGEDDSGVREDLARCLMKQMRPDEARPMVEPIFANREENKTGLIALLVEAFQNVGKHAEALQLIDRVRKVFPRIAERKDFKRYEKVSKKNLSSGKIIRSPHLVIPRKRTGEGAGWRFVVPRFIGIGVALLAAGGYLASCFVKGISRDVYLVNGLDKSYEVEIGGQHFRLPPHSEQMVQVHEGAVPVHGTSPETKVPDRTFTIETNFFARPFLNRTFVINPDGCALLLWEQIVYYPRNVAAAHQGDKNPYRLNTGEEFYVFNGIDYPFAIPPRNITMSENEPRRVKTALSLINKLSQARIVEVLSRELGNGKTVDYFKHHFSVDPGDPNTLEILASISNPKSMIEFLRPLLAERPVALQTHRLYQNLVEALEPDNQLESEYRQALAKEPTSSNLMYLAGRIATDTTEATKLFNQAAMGRSPCPYAFYALAYDEIASAHYSKGLDLIGKALALNPGDTSFVQMEIDALAGLENVDRLLEINAAQRKTSPMDCDLVGEQIRLLVQKGNGDDAAKRAGDEFVRRFGEGAKSEDILLWRTYFEGVAAYAHGDPAGYGKALARIPGDLNAFQSAFCLEKYQDAAAVLNRIKGGASALRLLVYIAARREGDVALAEKQLRAAVAEMEKSWVHERKAAACLKDGNNLSPNGVLDLKASIQEKRILLTAIGMRFEKLREPCFRLAALLNRDTRFPYLFLKSVVGPAPANAAEHGVAPAL